MSLCFVRCMSAKTWAAATLRHAPDHFMVNMTFCGVIFRLLSVFLFYLSSAIFSSCFYIIQYVLLRFRLQFCCLRLVVFVLFGFACQRAGVLFGCFALV